MKEAKASQKASKKKQQQPAQIMKEGMDEPEEKEPMQMDEPSRPMN